MRRSVVLLLLLGITVSGCDVPGYSTPRATPLRLPTYTPVVEVTDTPLPRPTAVVIPTLAVPPTLAIDTTQVKKQLAQVEADTAHMRGLAPRSAVPAHFISPDQMKYQLGEETLQTYTVDEAQLDATSLWLLLFIDDRYTDFRELQVEFAGTEVLGYYDQDKKELFVRADQPTLSPQSRETLAHEYVHSLQDQYHDLQKLLPKGLDHDREMATRALVEGDATISGILYASEYMSKGDFRAAFEASSDEVAPPVPGRAPVYLQEGWQFPYRYGSEFILELSPPGDYKPIDSAFKDPPVSTEQIMHPEKYLSQPRDNPLPVDLPPLPASVGAGWNHVKSDTLGEFDLDVMLRENYVIMPEATEGWGGARYDIYRNGDSYLAVMGSRWDTKRDLAEWEDGLTQSFKLYQKTDGLWTGRGRTWGVKRSGDMLVFVSGTERANVQKVLDSLKP